MCVCFQIKIPHFSLFPCDFAAVTSALSFFSLPPKLHQLLVQFQTGDKDQDFSLAPIQVSISVQLWRLPGCHEFLAALGESLVVRVTTGT